MLFSSSNSFAHLSLRRCTRSRRCSCCAHRTCGREQGGRAGKHVGGHGCCTQPSSCNAARTHERRRHAALQLQLLLLLLPPPPLLLRARGTAVPCSERRPPARVPARGTAHPPTCGTRSSWQDSTMSSSSRTNWRRTAGSGSARALIRLHRRAEVAGGGGSDRGARVAAVHLLQATRGGSKRRRQHACWRGHQVGIGTPAMAASNATRARHGTSQLGAAAGGGAHPCHGGPARHGTSQQGLSPQNQHQGCSYTHHLARGT